LDEYFKILAKNKYDKENKNYSVSN